MTTVSSTNLDHHRSRGARTRLLAPGLAAVLLGGWIAISLFHPFTPWIPQLGLDPSWTAALARGADAGLRWGVDFAFTYGPASTLVTGAYNAAYLPVTLPLLFATCLLFAATACLLARSGGAGAVAWAAVALGLAAALGAGFPDSFFLVLPIGPFLLALSSERLGRAETAVAAATGLAVGAIGMAKMSFPLSALPLFLLGDASSAMRRRAPTLTVSCVLGFLAADVIYGQSLADLPAFIRLQGEVVAGYSEAMALDGSRGELLAFPLASALLGAILVAAEWRRTRGARSRFALPLGFAWVLLLLFKAGFVRQDAHTLIAWHGLALVAILVAVARFRTEWPSLAAGVAGTAVLGVVLLTAIDSGRGPDERWAAAAEIGRQILIDGPAEQLAAAGDLLRDPSGFAAARRAEQDERWRVLAAIAPLPRLDGSVDVIPSEQSRVIANRLDLRSRPSLQEYGTYTPALLAANRAFLSGPRAPEWVLFGPEGNGAMTLDHRYPNFAEGALWLDLLERYGSARRIGNLAALRRRAEPAPLAIGEPRQSEVGFDEAVPVEPVGGAPGRRAVLATVELRPTLLGRLVAFLYKPVPMTMSVRFADGHEQLFQFLPGIASAGFILSPTVENASDFEALSDGKQASPDRVVTAFTLHAPPRLRFLLPSRVSVALRPVSGDAVGVRPGPGSAWSALAAGQDLGSEASSVAVSPPSSLNISVVGLSQVDLGYGLALAVEASPGVEKMCFAMIRVGGGWPTLWRRCLDRAAAADRAPQSVSLAVPPGVTELALVATCEGGCDEGIEGYWGAPP